MGEMKKLFSEYARWGVRSYDLKREDFATEEEYWSTRSYLEMLESEIEINKKKILKRKPFHR
tara:strand:+ start:1098 stop:1283 length:186 start_codon:yes stop_codon:yes gene_type:complete